MATTTAPTREYAPDAKAKSAVGAFPRVALSRAQEDAWDITRTRFVLTCPAFAHVFYTMMCDRNSKHLAYFTAGVPIAATDGVNLFLNPEPFFKLPLSQRVFVIAHEICHGILNHCGLMHTYKRRGKISYSNGSSVDYNPEIMNIATDLVINDMLVQSQVGAKVPDCLHDTSLGKAEDSALDVYKKLFDNSKGRGGIGKGGKAGTGAQGEHFDQHLEPGAGDGKDPESAKAERSEQEWKTEVAAGMAAQKAQQGKLPGAMERLFGEMLSPQVSWQEHIQSFFARKVGSGGYDWRRADRRLITREPEPIFAPGRSGFGCGTVVIGADSSGSVYDGNTLEMFFAEIGGILEDVKPKRLIVMWCDAKVHRVDEVEDAADLVTLRGKGAPGGGGTSFVPVFNEIEKMGLEPDALVYLTDGYGSLPAAAPSYPTLWGSIDCKPEHFPWGEVVMIPKGEVQ
jgi:predicted metal-dependent peptidase